MTDNMNFYKNFISLTVLLCLHLSFANGYYYGTTNSSFINGVQMNIELQFEDKSNSTILFAIDKYQNYLMFKTPEKFDDPKMFECIFNGFKFQLPLFFMGDSFDLSIHLDIKDDNFYSSDHQNTGGSFKNRILRFSNIYGPNKTNADSFLANFIPIDIQKQMNQTLIWLGTNRSVQFNNNNVPFKIHLSSCFATFDFNFYPINNYTLFGYGYSLECIVGINEVTCENHKCSGNYNRYRYLDCSLDTMAPFRHCFDDISDYSLHNISYTAIKETNYNNIIAFEWRQQLSMNYCLMQIILKNDSSIVLHTDPSNHLIMSRNIKQLKTSTILHNITTNNINNLILKFDPTQLIVKFYDGIGIMTFIESFDNVPVSINIGFSNFTKFDKFSGEIAFKYDTSIFKPILKINSQPSIISKDPITWIFVVIVIVCVLCLLVCIIIITIVSVRVYKDALYKINSSASQNLEMKEQTAVN